MSQINLLSQSFFKLPSIPNITHTLQLIETQKNFNFNSTVSLDQHISEHILEFEESDLSIENKIEAPQNEVTTSTSITKKKKNGCTCKKTKCLKMYCECFREGKKCTEDCLCNNCCNDGGHEDLIKKAREHVSHKLQNARHQGQGCHCKKSQCQKKYCECFNAGVPCGQTCRCENCANGTCESHGNPSPSNSMAEVIYEPESILLVLES